MEKTVLVELTSKQIKLAEGIVLFALFASLLAGFGLLYIAVPLGLGFFLLTLLCFVAFCLVRTYRWWDSDSFPSPFRSVWGSFFLRYCVSSPFVWCEPVAGGGSDKHVSPSSGNTKVYGRSLKTQTLAKEKIF